MKNAMQLKAIVKKISKEKNISAQLVLQNYILERLLERISLSKYHNNIILKGGFLIAAMIGIDARATMDMDVTIKGELVTIENISSVFSNIIKISVDDNIRFEFQGISEIRETDEYSGYRVHLMGYFAPMAIPLKLDVTTGDKITPQEIRYEYKTMMDENKHIPVLAYNLETILAEKLEAIFSRGDQTTRPRDYYDVYILWKLQGANVNVEYLVAALLATANKRSTLDSVKSYDKIIVVVQGSELMHEQWKRYQNNFDYAKNITFDETCNAIIEVMNNFVTII